MKEPVIIKRAHWESMRAHVNREAPLEACGLVAGVEGSSRRVYAIENELKSPVRYRLNPKQQLIAFQDIDEEGWELLAIYHSHPAGPAGPSSSDLAEAYYPEPLQLIWSRGEGGWECRAFVFEGASARELVLDVTDEE